MIYEFVILPLIPVVGVAAILFGLWLFPIKRNQKPDPEQFEMFQWKRDMAPVNSNHSEPRSNRKS